MSEELKACSYCGKQPQGNNWHTYGRNPKDEMRYFCANHDCPNGFHKVLTLEEWNTRPIEDALRAELAAAKAEVERLKGIIRKVEWDFKIGEYDAYHDVTTTDKYECLHCGFIFFSEMTRSHAESCPLYQWEAAK